MACVYPSLEYYIKKLNRLLVALSGYNLYEGFIDNLGDAYSTELTRIKIYHLIYRDGDCMGLGLVYHKTVYTKDLLNDSDKVLSEAAMMAIMYPQNK